MARLGLVRALVGCGTLFIAGSAWAGQASVADDSQPRPFVPSFVGLRFDLPAGQLDQAPAPSATTVSAPEASTQTPAPIAFEYSDAYRTRNKIHHIASFATLPLFGAEVYIGQRMFNNPANATSKMRHLHGGIAIAISGLFGVNTVTGVWNLVEARKDPQGTLRRTIHGVLMLVADAGFFATAIDRPNGRTASGLAIYDAKKNQHLALAYASLSVATAGYVMMLFR
jgi:hypothetical protein